MNYSDRLQKVREILNQSGVKNLSQLLGKIEPLRKGYYRVLDVSLAGDAPKDFIQVYKFGEAPQNNPKKWSKYIAKVGHKWYPIESITEHLMNQIGEVLGLNMAYSELRVADGQIRFLSKYFLKEHEELVHGAQIYSTYLGEVDSQFVDTIEEARLSPELFTFEFTKEAIETVFPNEKEEIMISFIKLLLFDAFTGNNDRHFYNWGVIVDIYGKDEPRFSPIYDTARGLYWNYSEINISKQFEKEQISVKKLTDYILGSKPKIGIENHKNLNHFELIREIFVKYPEYQEICKLIFNESSILQVITLLHTDFKVFFSQKRLTLIEECLKIRFAHLKSICNL